jgi:hypothetical protein
MRPKKVLVVSHLVCYWTTEQPLRDCVTEIIDRGTELSAIFWHPLRIPMVHSPDEVRILSVNLKSVWDNLTAEQKETHPFRREVLDILGILDSAAAEGDALVSVLEPPADEARATRVRCPFDEPETLSLPWGNLAAIEKFLSRR